MARPAVRLVPPLADDASGTPDGLATVTLDVDVVALPVAPGPRTSPGAVLAETSLRVLDALQVDGVPVDLVARAREALVADEAKGRPGSVTALPVPGAAGTDDDAGADPGTDPARRPRLVLLAGVGGARPDDLRRAGAVVARSARHHGTLRSDLLLTTPGPDPAAEVLRAHVEGLLLATYSFSRRSSRSRAEGSAGRDARPELARVDVAVAEDPALPEALARAEAGADATAFTRDLVNMPAAELTPDALAAAAERLPALVPGRDAGTLTVDVVRGDALADAGFGGVLAVGAGSVHAPCVVEARWESSEGAVGPHVVLVGKGITFDTGGLSLKPSSGMTTMKTDMAGGATVLGVLRAVAELALPVRLTVLVPAAENALSGSATRPGDVVTHVGGRTSEVLNTDAEGRLVLADALAHAAGRLSPDVVVDVATLTGAVRVALGTRTAGLFTPDDDLAAELVAASEAAAEPLWRLPLVEDYRAALESDVADLRNVGDPDLHLGGGSITAALFLQPFTEGMRWAHLDVAGAARSAEERDEVTKGSSGWGVRLLLRWLESLELAHARRDE